MKILQAFSLLPSAIRALNNLIKVPDLGASAVGVHILYVLLEQDGKNPTTIAVEVNRIITSFTPHLDKLQDAGLIERSSWNPLDRRTITITLTNKGKNAAQKVKQHLEVLEEKIGHKITSEFIETLEMLANLE